MPLSKPYLLVLFSVPFMRNAENSLCVSKAWAKDLIEHTKYIENLTLISYFSDESPPPDSVVIENNPTLKNVRFVMIPKPKNTLNAVLMLPRTINTIWNELNKTHIVHSAVAGWPIPEAWIICPLLIFKKRFHFINVESAFWRIPVGRKASVKQKIRSIINECFNKWCLQRANLTTFTHEGYKKSLLGKIQHKGFVIPASWIDAENIIDSAQFESLQQTKLNRINKPIKLIFVGRLVVEKGILLLIQAVSDLLDENHLLTLDIIGDGPLLNECKKLIQTNNMNEKIKLCGTVSYGQEFFILLQSYDLMIVPSLSDEQPRNVFDAFSQALPLLCSDTEGLIQCVDINETGYFFKTGDIESLKYQLIQITENRLDLLNLGSSCVIAATKLTHKEMHLKRLEIMRVALTHYE